MLHLQAVVRRLLRAQALLPQPLQLSLGLESLLRLFLCLLSGFGLLSLSALGFPLLLCLEVRAGEQGCGELGVGIEDRKVVAEVGELLESRVLLLGGARAWLACLVRQRGVRACHPGLA